LLSGDSIDEKKVAAVDEMHFTVTNQQKVEKI
jgi:hypothetical protein